ncbi:MAG: zinc ribbon domain-containing protein [Phycisphaerales bacterium]|jgi:putative FmdB family regulatory protein|nr:zinc ribbon domain-containing protein [Phycisphaerales bacterium]
MPTYEYKCGACGHQFERFQSITAAPIKKCPECGKLRVKRLLGTGAGLIFKGSGFYITDYRSDSYNKSAKAESGGDQAKTSSDSTSKGTSSDSAKPATATSTTKSDAKPAASAKDKPKSSK